MIINVKGVRQLLIKSVHFVTMVMESRIMFVLIVWINFAKLVVQMQMFVMLAKMVMDPVLAPHVQNSSAKCVLCLTQIVLTVTKVMV